jgi:NADH:ubiquinone oxidoreductase subunit
MLAIIRFINAFFIRFTSQHMGTDSHGNEYYARTEKSFRGGMRQRRFIVYNGFQEASKIDAAWHGWLHHATDLIPGSADDTRSLKSWDKPHQENTTGTTDCYLPTGHAFQQSSAESEKIKKPYEAWKPE